MHPVVWYDSRTTSVFQKTVSFNDIKPILDGLVQSRLWEELEDCVGDQDVVFLRGITFVEDNDEEVMGSVHPEILPGHKDEAEDDSLFRCESVQTGGLL